MRAPLSGSGLIGGSMAPEPQFRKTLLDLQPVHEVAAAILAGHAFTDLDAIRVAAAFLDLHEKQTT
jgi:hypothetical protein